MDLSSHEGEIPLPITITSKYGGDHGHGYSPIIHDPQHTSNGPSQPTPSTTTITATATATATIATPTPTPTPDGNHHHNLTYSNSGKKGVVVKYRECMKNHAASIGGNATDGCGEFMPSGEEGTMEALKCSACSCHRNFHRKEVEGESSLELMYHYHHHHPKGRKVAVGEKGVLISGSDAFGYTPSHNSLIPLPSPHQMIMPLGAMQTSESDEMEGVGGGFLRPSMLKKRFRTKFTPDQKEKMRSFAEKVGWRLQKQEESVVQQFCQEIGVKRRVLKVWMHNNKHNMANKSSIQLE